ncbi:MAG: hypothetical protein CL944_02615 [Candidatus Diapherotrites archaeon]|uniref:Uncharacterized protein n=1 Tax=Candidatus Iainarchaeum sp. TaxID=3101447 RepID=A0A2D6LQ80_9ARCH|nr:hypothetical protein [Candidatus Diapherotrites archaeon]|tara:strand:- start:2025 stop:2249 length:225 start_codon:yes stop_codon:yes gene_type:complete
MIHPKKTLFLAIGLLVVFGSFVLLSFFLSLHQIFTINNVFSGSNPTGVFAIFAIIIFGGIYLFNTAGHVIKGAL